jgi:hypothetical protein
MLFNAEYIKAHDLDPNGKLPPELRGQCNVWFSSNIPFNKSSNELYSSWSADTIFVDAASACVRTYNGEIVDFEADDSAAEDVLVTSERLRFAGSLILTKNGGKITKKWTVLACSIFNPQSDLTTVSTVLSPTIDMYTPVIMPRCPFDPRTVIEPVPRSGMLAGSRYMRVGFEAVSGLFEATSVTINGERFAARVIAESVGLGETVLSLLPTTAKQVNKLFAASSSVRALRRSGDAARRPTVVAHRRGGDGDQSRRTSIRQGADRVP